MISLLKRKLRRGSDNVKFRQLLPDRTLSTAEPVAPAEDNTISSDRNVKKKYNHVKSCMAHYTKKSFLKIQHLTRDNSEVEQKPLDPKKNAQRDDQISGVVIADDSLIRPKQIISESKQEEDAKSLNKNEFYGKLYHENTVMNHSPPNEPSDVANKDIYLFGKQHVSSDITNNNHRLSSIITSILEQQSYHVIQKKSPYVYQFDNDSDTESSSYEWASDNEDSITFSFDDDNDDDDLLFYEDDDNAMSTESINFQLVDDFDDETQRSSVNAINSISRSSWNDVIAEAWYYPIISPRRSSTFQKHQLVDVTCDEHNNGFDSSRLIL